MNKKGIFLAATIVCVFSSFAFTFDATEIIWNWEGKDIVPQILVVSALILGILWFSESKDRIKIEKG